MNRRLAVNVVRVGVGPGGEQQREGYPVILLCGDVQRGLAKVRRDVHLGPVIEQPPDRLRPSVARGPVEWCPELVALQIDVGVVVEQQLHRRELAVPCSVMKGRVAGFVAGVGGLVVLGEQHVEAVEVALGGGGPNAEWRGLLRVQGGRCGDEKDEQAGDGFGESPHKAAQFAHAAWARRARKPALKKA